MRQRKLRDPKNRVILVDRSILKPSNPSNLMDKKQVRDVLPFDRRAIHLGFLPKPSLQSLYSSHEGSDIYHAMGDRYLSTPAIKTRLEYLKDLSRTVLREWANYIQRRKIWLYKHRQIWQFHRQNLVFQYWNAWILRSTKLCHRAMVWTQYYHRNHRNYIARYIAPYGTISCMEKEIDKYRNQLINMKKEFRNNSQQTKGASK